MVPALPRLPSRRNPRQCALTLVLLTSLVGAVSAADSEFVPPQGLASERYAPIWERTPFALKVAVDPTTTTRSFAENFALAGLSDVEGQITVYLKDKVSGEYVKLTNQSPSESGIEFEKIVEDPDPKLVKVSVRKGTETGLVGYSQEPAGGVGAGPGGPVPGQASGLGKKPAQIPPGPTPGGSAPPNGDPNAQQKSRRRIILPQAGAPQSSINPPITQPAASPGTLSHWAMHVVSPALSVQASPTPL